MPDPPAPVSGPIGVFDSGVGGLSVLRELRTLLPKEDLLYIADSGHVPYGSKSQAYIQRRALTLAQFLSDQGAKLIVIACNTATAAAAVLLRATFSTPIVAMEPAVKPAAAATRTGVVGVLATSGTLQSATFAALLARFGQHVRVVAQPCPGLVEQVEAGDLNGPDTRALINRYTKPLLVAGADTIVLGCTHYPFVAPLIAEAAGRAVTLIDTGPAVAHQVQHVLQATGRLSDQATPGRTQFWTSGNPEMVARVVSVLWGERVAVKSMNG